MEAQRIYGIIAETLEGMGTGIIALAFIGGSIRAARTYLKKREDVFNILKFYIGRALLLGLEFLVAADIIRTIMIETTIRGVVALGLMILVRTILGWSVVVEIEGCWPWQVAEKKRE